MRNPQDHGFVLVIVLLVLSVMSLLTLEQYQNLLLQENIQHRHQSQFRQRQQLLLAARTLVAYPAIPRAPCLTRGHQSRDILAQLNSPNACQMMIEQRSIRYSIEPMGQEPCVHIQADFATQHYQLWLKVQGSTLVLRVHYAISTNVRQCNTHPSRPIAPGIQSWNISGAD
ncbi:MAG: hypothetical protein JJT82_07300 [Legionellaceae bacterium]|nr:hypothetical protein [Legionellaceae bacterium]